MAEINWSLAQTPDYFGGAIRSQQAGQAARAEQDKARAYQLYAQNPQAGLQAIMQADPQAGIQLQRADALAERQAKLDERQAELDARPKYIEGPDGIYAIDPATGAPKRVADYPAKEPTAPSGYTWADGNKALQYIPGGPGDPEVYGQRATVQRRAVVQNPTPSRASGGGGSAGLSSMTNEQLIALAKGL